MHLRELQLRLRSCPLWQRRVPDDVAQRLAFGFVLLEDFAFCVVADDFVVDEAGEVQAAGAELGHVGGGVGEMVVMVVVVKMDEVEKERMRRYPQGQDLRRWC